MTLPQPCSLQFVETTRTRSRSCSFRAIFRYFTRISKERNPVDYVNVQTSVKFLQARFRQLSFQNRNSTESSNACPPPCSLSLSKTEFFDPK